MATATVVSKSNTLKKVFKGWVILSNSVIVLLNTHFLLKSKKLVFFKKDKKKVCKENLQRFENVLLQRTHLKSRIKPVYANTIVGY